jgi:hypothetical protein
MERARLVGVRPGGLVVWRLLSGDRFDGDKAAGAATVDELDAAIDFSEEGVVGAAADVEAGLNPGAALADDDGTAGDNLASEELDAEALCVGVAAVFRAA